MRRRAWRGLALVGGALLGAAGTTAHAQGVLFVQQVAGGSGGRAAEIDQVAAHAGARTAAAVRTSPADAASPGERALIQQSGVQESAEVLQTAPATAFVLQSGAANAAVIRQDGAGAWAQIVQHGVANVATIVQAASRG